MTKNTDGNLRKHPYMDYENAPLWEAVNKSLAELEENRDIKLFTSREYVIGFICREIKEKLKTDRF